MSNGVQRGGNKTFHLRNTAGSAQHIEIARWGIKKTSSFSYKFKLDDLAGDICNNFLGTGLQGY